MSKQNDFRFKEIDPEGYETLKVISDAVNFNNWTFDVIKKYCSGEILEIGSGIGNISSRFLNAGYELTLSDIRSNYCDFLGEKFPERLHKNAILNIDLVLPEFEKNYNSLLGKFDTVFALNVVEHIKDDNLAVANCYKLLKPGGKLILLMPAFQWLYNSFDKELQHYKRYNRNMMKQLMEANNFNIEKSFYFNAGGIPGWIVSGNVFNNKIIPAGQMRTFDKLVPIFRLTDKFLNPFFGLSVICVGKSK